MRKHFISVLVLSVGVLLASITASAATAEPLRASQPVQASSLFPAPPTFEGIAKKAGEVLGTGVRYAVTAGQHVAKGVQLGINGFKSTFFQIKPNSAYAVARTKDQN